MLDAHHLNVFLAAAETLSFTRAAQRLHMTQPSVSQNVQALEQFFGGQLFFRDGHRLRLTDMGATLLPLAREMVALSVRIEETMESLKGNVHGHLCVGCSTTPGKYVLPHLLADFLRLHPNVKATCHVTSRRVALQMLCDGAVHLAVASAREECRDVEFRRFITDPVLLITPLGHPWAGRDSIDAEELLDASFIMREEGSGTHNAVRDGLAEVGLSIHGLRTVLTLGNSEAIALAVQEGIGVGFVSRMVEAKLVRGRVAPVRVRGLDVKQDIYIAHHTRRAATAAQAAFWDFVHDPDNAALRRLSMTALGMAPQAAPFPGS